MSTPPASILYVGNSYLSFNNGIGWHVSRLHASSKPARRLRSTSAVITGGGLAWHDVESYFRPNAVGSYSFDEANDIVFHDDGTRYELVLMMDCSHARFIRGSLPASGTLSRGTAPPCAGTARGRRFL